MTTERPITRAGHNRSKGAARVEPAEEPRISQTDAALTQLRSRIIDLTLPPGSRIDEPLLLTRFQLGRTPAREAINRLAAEGFVIIQPGRGGTFVRPLDFAEIRDIVVARQLVENVGAQGCRLDDDDLSADLNDLQREYAKHLRAQDYLMISEVSARFHLRLLQTVGNPFFYNFAESTHRHNQRLNVYLYQLESSRKVLHQREFELDLEEHAAIIRAVTEQDHPTLKTLLTEHARGTQRRLVRLMQEGAVADFDITVDLDPALAAVGHRKPRSSG